MMTQLPVLIIICPLIASLMSLLLGRINLNLSRIITFAGILASLVFSTVLLYEVVNNGTVYYCMGGYERPIGIEFAIDSLSAVLLVLISLFGSLTYMFTTPIYLTDDKTLLAGTNGILGLLVVGMLGMTATGDVFNLYVFLEITSLSAYCLISLGGSKGVVAAFRYMLAGTVAATFYLIGVAILYGATGTLNMADMEQILNDRQNDVQMLIAMIFFIGSFGIKMSLFPFHAWQPSAYTHAESGSRPLIAGVMGKIPAYGLFRYLFCIFGTDFKYMKYFLTILGILSVGAMLYGSIRAMAQKDLRKMLAYSSVAQIGYISLGFAIGTPIALAGAFLHLIGHAFMKGGMFFSAGAIRAKYGSLKLDNLGYIYKKMPMTAALLVIAVLSMVGIPPTVGFFSKWYLALGAVSTQHFIYLAVLVISSLLNAIYFFKLIEKIFTSEDKHAPSKMEKSATSLPLLMQIPIIVCFLAILLIGIFNVKIVDILLITLEGVAL